MPRAFLITHRRYRQDADDPVQDADDTDVDVDVGVDTEHDDDSNSSGASGGQDHDGIVDKQQVAGRIEGPIGPGGSVGLAGLAELAGLAVAASSWGPRTSIPVQVQVPDELFNLTQLAEVSLAAAAAQGHRFRSATRDREHDSGTLRGRGGNPSPVTVVAAHCCPDCGKSYSTASNLARHRQTHRSLAGQQARGCPTCGKLYVSIPAFAMHVRTHAQACRCEFCGKTFSRPWLLQGHVRTHTGEKPFKCGVCAKAFADKSNLRAHVQTHSDAKPHVCARCGKAFALKSYLYKHEEASCLRGGPSGPTSSRSLSSSPPSSPDPDVR